MPLRLEITLKPDIRDSEGEAFRRKALDYFGLTIPQARLIQVLTLDAGFSEKELSRIRKEIFTNPVTQRSSYHPLAKGFDWVIWVGLKPGVRDNAGSTAREAISDLLKRPLVGEEAVYTSKQVVLRAPALSRDQVELLARELLANEIIQNWKVFSRKDWDPKVGIGLILPKVILNHRPRVTTFSLKSDEILLRLSRERNLALHPQDVPVIRAYFNRPKVKAMRARVGLSLPTDVELEYISQARSDHCNHNTFQAVFDYRDLATGRTQRIDNLFKTCIEAPTLALAKEKDWVVSVLWDNAGVGRFDEDHYYVITGETHNSPSNMEAYGGALTGIVGVYRDPMGTGKGSKLVLGTYGFCVGPRDYPGPLIPHLHPRRLLDGIVEGVKDGGNKSGIPTAFGQLTFDSGYLGKCLVFVAAMGIMPSKVDGTPSEKKTTREGDLILMIGGRVGKDGIHGVTASSEAYSPHTPAGHVQIGDPYTQKKMHDFLLEAREEGLIAFITDNGGGGLSSSIGESARFSGGAEVDLARVPLKYAGLDQWEIWVSESQERMTAAVNPDHEARFMALARKHEVEATVIGRYTATGKLHLRYGKKTCAYVDLDLLKSAFPKWRFKAEWIPPEQRGLFEPALTPPSDHGRLLLDLLARPNIASRAWISRQYDHEVQGGSVIKPLVGKNRNLPSDAAVMRPVLTSIKGLAVAQALLPWYSRIDTYHMVAATMEEALRRVLAVGGDPEHISGVDNFCWPNIRFDERENPDGKYKAAQLVRANLALRDMCLAFRIPLLSGKDSMYVDGYLQGPFGEHHKVSGLPTLQFTTTSVIPDVRQAVTLEAKAPEDLVYLLGWTGDELGGSEYYEFMGYTGLKVPQVHPKTFRPLYLALARAIREQKVASVHGIYRGGLGIHLALTALGGELGLEIDLSKVPVREALSPDRILYSESCGRFLITAAPRDQKALERLFQGLPLALIGRTRTRPALTVLQGKNNRLFELSLQALGAAWERPFGELI
jgi:phosphoribosylformylglycinamidine synthase